MSYRIKALLALGLFVGVSACASVPEPEEIIIIEPAPIMVEPVYNKYS
jgi:hypothetical protein